MESEDQQRNPQEVRIQIHNSQFLDQAAEHLPAGKLFDDFLPLVSGLLILKMCAEGQSTDNSRIGGDSFFEHNFQVSSWDDLIHLKKEKFLRIFSEGLSFLPRPSASSKKIDRGILSQFARLYTTEFKSRHGLELAKAWVSSALENLGKGIQASYMDLLEQVLTKAQVKGDFTTTPYLSHMMVSFAQPKAGEKIYDPCFGTGLLLEDTYRHLTKLGTKGREFKLFGNEISPSIFMVGATRMLLSGCTTANLYCDSSLDKKPSNKFKYDCIITDFPSGRTKRPSLSVTSNDEYLETLFLEHVMNSMSEGGRAVLLMPQRLLSAIGKESILRKRLVEEFSLDFMAESDFRWGDLNPTKSLVCLQKKKPAQDIWLVNGEILVEEPPIEEEYEDGGPRIGNGVEETNLRLEVLKDLIQIRQSGNVDWDKLAQNINRIFYLRDLDRILDNGLDDGYWGTDYGWNLASILDFFMSNEAVQKILPKLTPQIRFFSGAVKGKSQKNSAWGWFNHYLDEAELFSTYLKPEDLTSEYNLFLSNYLAVKKYTRTLQRTLRDFPKFKLVKLAEVSNILTIEDPPPERAEEHGISCGVIDHTSKDPVPQHGSSLLSIPQDYKRTQVNREQFVHNFFEFLPNGNNFYYIKENMNIPQDLIDQESTLLVKKNDILAAYTGRYMNARRIGDLGFPAIPVKGIYIIRPNVNVDANYILRVLNDRIYVDYISSLLKGNVSDISILQNLTIPVPPKSLADLLVFDDIFLHENSLLLSGSIRRRLSKLYWPTHQELVQLEHLIDNLDLQSDEKLSTSLQNFLGELKRTIDTFRENERITDEDLQLLNSFEEHLANFLNAINYSDKAEKLYLLEKVFKDGNDLLRQWSKTATMNQYYFRPMIKKCIRRMSKVLRLRIDGLLNVQLSGLQILNAALVEDEPGRMMLSIKNQGIMSLLDVRINTEPVLGTIFRDQVAAGEEIQWQIDISPRKSGHYRMLVQWQGKRIDGKLVKGEIPTSFEVGLTSSAGAASSLEYSPYIVGKPVEDPDMFFGRKKVLEQIKNQFKQVGRANILLLEGNRRTGKSSILKYLLKTGLLNEWIPVYSSFQGGEGDCHHGGLPTREIFSLLARDTAFALHDRGFEVEIPEQKIHADNRTWKLKYRQVLKKYFEVDSPFAQFEGLLAMWLERIQPKGLLWMMDEFDKIQEGISSGVTSSIVPENIRYLFHVYPNLSAILTGSKRLKKLREEYWSALFGLGKSITLNPMEEDEAKDLVQKPVAGRLSYTLDAVDHIVKMCGFQPFLIQGLCDRIFDLAIERKSAWIDNEWVEKAIKEWMPNNEHLQVLWDYCDSPRRRLVTYQIARLAHENRIIGFDAIENTMQSLSIIVPPEILVSDLEHLEQMEIIKQENRGPSKSYCLTLPLLERWIEAHIDLDLLRKEAVSKELETIR